MRSKFSYNYLFSSFFGAVMIAGAFAYYNYKFSEYKFFDFKQHTFYTTKDIFVPSHRYYTVLVYSSNMQDVKKLAANLKKNNPILAIDLYQKRFKEEDSIISISSGMNTLLKFIQRFNIYDVPCAFEIKQIKNELYKQDTMIEKL
jgi:uncharacterized membrane-anchored protein YitT (DUF2179 family)